MSHWQSRFSLNAALTASATIGAILVSAAIYGERLERHSIHLVTHELAIEQDKDAEPPARIGRMERIKNQGMSLLRMAMQQPDLVSLYGSSELRKPIPNKAGIFFGTYPTGFAVFQVGKAGTTSIIMLEKIASAAPASGPRRVALSLSPSWFLEILDPHYYSGNFSRQQAMALLFNPRLSFGLKHDLARRMSEFPDTLDRGSLLAYTVELLRRGSFWDHLLYQLVFPLGVLENAVYSGQDHFETALYILDQRRGWDSAIVRQERALDWSALVAQSIPLSPELHSHDVPNRKHFYENDAALFQAMDRSPEWGDFELLLRTFRELGFEPLILSIPLEGQRLEVMGVSRDGVAEYGRRLHAICDRYGVRLESFDDHSEDQAFLYDHHDHLSVKGWVYYNKALDDYFHRRHTPAPAPPPDSAPAPAPVVPQ